MNEKLEERIKKCPKVIQEYISTLKYNNMKLSKDNDELRGNLTNTNTYINQDYKSKFYLDNHTRVCFDGDNVKIEVFTDLDGRIRIDIGDGVIIPMARNIIYIVKKDYEY